MNGPRLGGEKEERRYPARRTRRKRRAEEPLRGQRPMNGPRGRRPLNDRQRNLAQQGRCAAKGP